MRFSVFVIKNVVRRPVRSALTVLGMAIAVSALVSLVGLSKGFEQSFLKIYEQQRVDLMVQRAGSNQRLGNYLDESLEYKIQAIPGVARVNCGLVDMMSPVSPKELKMVIVQGIPARSSRFSDFQYPQGRRLQEDDHGKILVGTILAANAGLRIGDTVEIVEDQKFVVQGVFQSDNVYDNGGMILLLPDMQQLLSLKGKVLGFTVVVDRPGDRELIQQVAQRIEALQQGMKATPIREFVGQTPELRVVRGMAWVTSAIAMVIGTVLVLNTMIMSVFERTREIGILRAIGWGPGRIMRMILMESLLLSLIASVCGVAVAVALVKGLSRLPVASGMVSSDISPGVMLQGFVIALLVGVAGAAYPAYRGARLLPTEAIRHE
jgi:putative ABC transport system permease protein